MIDQQTLEHFRPLAYHWVKAQEDIVLKYGSPLRPAQSADAARVGVAHPEKVRVLVVDRIALPDDEALAEAASRAHIITSASRAVSFGYGIIIRADSWQDRELMVHCLVHVAQCERHGGLENFLGEYLADRGGSAEFSLGALEEEARSVAREICATTSKVREEAVA